TNSIASVTGLTAGQSILLTSTGTTGITGPVQAGGSLTLQGAAFAESGAGAIRATGLTGSVSGGLTLGGANSIATLGSLSAGSDIVLNDAQALNLAGLVTTPGTLTLTDAAAVTEAGGAALSLGGLAGQIGGGLTLGGANSIATLASLSAGGDMLIANIGTMTLNGPVSAGTSLALVTAGLLEGTGGSLAAGTIAIAPYNAGTLDLGGTAVAGLQLAQALVSAFDSHAVVIIGAANGVRASSVYSEGNISFANALVTLTSSGAITQTGTLGGQGFDLAGGTMALNGDISAGTFTADSTGGLSQSGTLSGTAVSLSGSSLGLDGSVEANTLTLQSAGAISQGAGAKLNAASLTGSAGTSIALGGTNSIASVTGLTAGSGIDLQDAHGLAITGSVAAAQITLSAPTLSLAAPVSVAGVALLDSAGTLTQSAPLRAGT
ncbi:hypothetical protein, partial [Acidocella sp. MX-AZ02]|uniref:beta strand repeat-containing protein n=5 Tax=unclassified Acidocella TaxID=2648610 RepID=UPI00028E5715